MARREAARVLQAGGEHRGDEGHVRRLLPCFAAWESERHKLEPLQGWGSGVKLG